MSCKHSGKDSRAAATSYLSLVAAGEPFRLLFPLGTLIGIVGVALWPLHVWKNLPDYPGIMHSRIMIEGFLTSFVIGFLGTALPRLLDVKRFTLGESFLFAAALVVVVCCHAIGRPLAGDIGFVLVIIGLMIALLARLPQRRDVPPPAFVLVAGGLLCALVGGSIAVIAGWHPEWLPDLAFPLGRLLLHQGYLLLPIMGIGAFLLPRFFGLPNRQNFPESLALPPGWIPRALFAAACGAMVIASFVIEAKGGARVGNALRALALLVYFTREVPVHRAASGGGSLANGLRVSLACLPLGYLCMAVWPEHQFSFIHVVAISGFSLLTFIVASRVVLGHSGQVEKFRARIPAVAVMTGLILLAMFTRVSADWMPAIRLSHYAYAGLSWIAGVLVWAWCLLPSVRVADESE